MSEQRTFTTEDNCHEDMPGFTTTRRRKYKLEDLIEVYAMDDCQSEGMPTMKQICEYGVLIGMIEDLKAELGTESLFEELKEKWNSILEKEKHKKE